MEISGNSVEFSGPSLQIIAKILFHYRIHSNIVSLGQLITKRAQHQLANMAKDRVLVKDISAVAIIGNDAWNRPTPQPINISVAITTNFLQASVTDNLKHSINYAVLTRNISEYLKSHENRNLKSLGNIAVAVHKTVLREIDSADKVVEVAVRCPKLEIRADSVEYKLTRGRGFQGKEQEQEKEKETSDCNGLAGIISTDRVIVNKLRLLTIIGVFTFERLQKQIVDLTLDFSVGEKNVNLDVRDIVADVVAYVESSNFKTVEALVHSIGRLTFQKHSDLGIKQLVVTVIKPHAFNHVEGVGVSSTMVSKDFDDLPPIDCELDKKKSDPSNTFTLPATNLTNTFDGLHTAYLAFGSNSGGDLCASISKALGLLKNYDIDVIATSSMYISKPMYHLNQPDFFNGAVKVQFKDYSPLKLLEILKEIEYTHMSRRKEFNNGPREIDLDILLYDDLQITLDNLVIPHKSMLERTFVLQPLCELIPPDYIHPVSAEPIHNHLSQLLKAQVDETMQEDSQLLQYIPIKNRTPAENVLKFDQTNFQSQTLIMGILNMTPDSFSDGGKYYDQELDKIVNEAIVMVQDGAHIIDIGGVSTRPGSTEPSEEEELARVLPLVKALRASSSPILKNTLISIDTYRSKVAEQCLEAGADIINDVSMGLYDERIFEVVAKYGCPYIMNHTRGTPLTMSKLTNYDPLRDDDIIESVVNFNSDEQSMPRVNTEIMYMLNGVARELSLQMLKSFKYGVKKWQIIVDPGVGFAKNMEQNVAIVRNASFFKKYSIQLNSARAIGDGGCNGDGGGGIVNDDSPKFESSTEQRSKPTSFDRQYLTFCGMSVLLGTSRKKFLGTITGKIENKSDRVMATAATVTAGIEQHTDIVRVHDVKDMKDIVKVSDAIYKGTKHV